MSKIEVKQKGHPLDGLWLWDCAYSLNGKAFNDKIKKEILEKTKLQMSDETWDWWTFEYQDNPILDWQQIITLALSILNCKATKRFVHSLHIEEIPEFEFVDFDGDLPRKTCRGAKRVNADAGDYMDYSGIVGIQGLMNQIKGIKVEPKKVEMSNNVFRLSGKDESCCVEGSWLDWCMFACNVLASENTKLIAPDIYAEGLSNKNYN